MVKFQLVQPLAITRYSIVNCLGAGARAIADAMRERRSGLAPCDFETVALDTHIGRVPGSKTLPVRPDLGAYDCRNNRLAQLGARAGRLRRRRGAGTRALRRGAHRRVHRHQHLRHPADRARLSRPRAGDRRAAGRLPLRARRTTPSRSPTSCSATSGCTGPAVVGLLGVLVERQGVRQRGAHDRRGRLRRGRGRRRGHAVPHDALRLPLAGADLARALPALRRGSATASPSAKAPASRCSSGSTRGPTPAPSGCSASARAAMPTTCRRRIPTAWARGSRCSARWQPRASLPPTSTT